jgi:hypothetical protein
MVRHKSGPPAGTFRAGLEITNRSGWLTRAYRLILLPDRVRVAYADGRTSYDVRFDEAAGGVTCTCPAFEADGGCKHRDAVLALKDALTRRLEPGTPPHASAHSAGVNSLSSP